MADQDSNSQRELRVAGVSDEVRARIGATHAAAVLLMTAGETWTIKRLAEKLELSEAQVKEIVRSPEFDAFTKQIAPRNLERFFVKSVKRLDEMVDDPDATPQTVLSAIKTGTALYKTLVEMGPKQDDDEGVAHIRNIREQIRSGERKIRIVQEDAQPEPEKKAE